MKRFASIGRALGNAVISLFGVSVLSFVLLRLTPGDPVGLVLGPFATSDARRRLTEQMGLDRPVWQQYLDYLGAIAHGDLGYSYASSQSVATLLAQRVPATLEIGLCAVVITVVGATVFAVLKTLVRVRLVRAVLDGISFLSLSVPQFWLALLLLLVFSEWLGITPGPQGRISPSLEPPATITGLYSVDSLLRGQWTVFADVIAHLVLPSVALALYGTAFLGRVMYANLDVHARSSIVTASRLRGLTRSRAVLRHALPNALVPSVTAAGVLVGGLLTASVLIEGVFVWPGVGAAVTNGIQKQDYSVVQAFILISAAIVIIINLVAELIAARIDPRVRDAQSRHNSSRIEVT
ncbi:MAG: ABC transporter permease [Gordonia sp. (in: high G+C Gram-positive bacteria)]